MDKTPIEQEILPEGNEKIDNLKKIVEASSVKISDIASIALRNWYWIVLFLAFCLCLGWLMVQRATPLYTQSMAVLLRDDAEGSGTGSSSIRLSDLGLQSTNTVLEDEMEALRSPDLMAQVVVGLGLETLYSSPGTFHDNVLYGSSIPVRVSFPDMDPNETASMRVVVDSQGHIQVSNLYINQEPFKVNPETPVTFGGAINTPSGRIVFQKSPFFQEGQPYIIDVRRLSLESAANMFGREISVDMSANKHSNVIEIVCVDANLQRADDILSSLLKCYNQNWLKSRAEVVSATNDFINQRLASVEQELNGVDNSISSYKSSNLVPDVEQTSNLYLQESAAIDNQILNYNNQLQMARYLKNYISNEGKNQVLPVNSGLSNTNIEALVSEYNTLVMQRNSYLANTSEANPLVVDIDSRLASLRKSILSSIDNAIVSLSTTVSNMERKEQSHTARVSESPKQAKFLLSAERKQKVQENLYVYLLQKREENELSQSFVSVNTRILRKPSGPKDPTYPRPVQTYLIAFVLGLAIPVGAIYLREVSNTKVRGRKDIEAMSIPVVGEIPKCKKSGKKKVSYFKGEGKEKRMKASIREDIVVEHGNRNLVNEAIRVLRSNITRMTANQPSSVMMITSFNPGSGKTFISINLGVALALKGHRTLLIDGDLRRASLSRFAGNPRKGFADYLSGACRNIDEVIKKDCVVEGLDLLPVGAIPPNPTELLETSRFTNLIESLRADYEYIFIDCPPGEMMADAQIIGDVCDRTIFVMRVGVFQRSLLPDLERHYESKKYPNMMLVLNGSSVEARYGYSYSYGYGYDKRKSRYTAPLPKGKKKDIQKEKPEEKPEEKPKEKQ